MPPRQGAQSPMAQLITAGLQTSQGCKRASKPNWRNLRSDRKLKSLISPNSVFLWDLALARDGPDSHFAQLDPEERKVTD